MSEHKEMEGFIATYCMDIDKMHKWIPNSIRFSDKLIKFTYVRPKSRRGQFKSFRYATKTNYSAKNMNVNF